MDHERVKISESSSLTDQGYQTLMNFTRHSVVETLVRSLAIVEGEVTPEPESPGPAAPDLAVCPHSGMHPDAPAG